MSQIRLPARHGPADRRRADSCPPDLAGATAAPLRVNQIDHASRQAGRGSTVPRAAPPQIALRQRQDREEAEVDHGSASASKAGQASTCA